MYAKPTIISIVGPTASGKSANSIKLAQHLGGEIICMDSATIYTQMDIGTAKPSLAEQALVKHHLIDICDPALAYSAAEFAADAAKLVKQLWQAGKQPIICGGTMMYFKSLRYGLNDLPSANPEIRAELEQQAKDLGWPAMHAKLADIDPQTAARLAPNDSQRIQRALEIWHASNRTMSSWLNDKPKRLLADWDFKVISLEPSDRSQLHQRIAIRYEQMLELGLLEEVNALYKRGDLNIDMPSIRCVGYRQIWQHLNGEFDLETAIERAVAATRQLAKRQITWLRSMPERKVLDCLDPNLNIIGHI